MDFLKSLWILSLTPAETLKQKIIMIYYKIWLTAYTYEHIVPLMIGIGFVIFTMYYFIVQKKLKFSARPETYDIVLMILIYVGMLTKSFMIIGMLIGLIFSMFLFSSIFVILELLIEFKKLKYEKLLKFNIVKIKITDKETKKETLYKIDKDKKLEVITTKEEETEEILDDSILNNNKKEIEFLIYR